MFLHEDLSFSGNWLLTSPDDTHSAHNLPFLPVNIGGSKASSRESLIKTPRTRHYGATLTRQEKLGTVENSGDMVEGFHHPPGAPFSSGYSSSRRRNKHSTHTSDIHVFSPNFSNPVANVYMSEDEERAYL